MITHSILLTGRSSHINDVHYRTANRIHRYRSNVQRPEDTQCVVGGQLLTELISDTIVTCYASVFQLCLNISANRLDIVLIFEVIDSLGYSKLLSEL